MKMKTKNGIENLNRKDIINHNYFATLWLIVMHIFSRHVWRIDNRIFASMLILIVTWRWLIVDLNDTIVTTCSSLKPLYAYLYIYISSRETCAMYVISVFWKYSRNETTNSLRVNYTFIILGNDIIRIYTYLWNVILQI